MFSIDDRARLRDELIQRARDDDRVVAAASIGSAARGAEDEWSDIDLALSVSPSWSIDTVADDWTSWFGSRLVVADTFDVRAGGGLYRVFLGVNSLQIDLSFFSPQQFGAKNEEPMTLLFGDANPAEPAPDFDWRSVARMGWLYALHARSAIGRNRLLQADMMLADLRNGIIAVASARLGGNSSHGRAAHTLPAELAAALIDSRPRDVSPTELGRSLLATCDVFLDEVGRNDASYAETLRPALAVLTQSVGDPRPGAVPELPLGIRPEALGP